MKILLDMSIPLKYVALLSDRGIMALRWSDVGAPNASDVEIMAYARENNYIVLTYDLDFSAILSTTHELKTRVAQNAAAFQCVCSGGWNTGYASTTDHRNICRIR